MRSTRQNPPQARQEAAGRVLALPADSHEVFQREMRQSLSKAAAVNAVPSAYSSAPYVQVTRISTGLPYAGSWADDASLDAPVYIEPFRPLGQPA